MLSACRLGARLSVLVALGCSEPGSAGEPAQSGGTAGSSAGAGGAAAGGSGAGGSAGTAAGWAGGASGGAGGIAGAAGSGGAPLAPTFAVVAEIMRQNCGALSCHGGGPEGQDLVFVDASSLYGILTTKVVTECGGALLVKPGDPANSALVQLPSWQCGDLVMPKGCIDDPCLTLPEMDAIRAWISAGASAPSSSKR